MLTPEQLAHCADDIVNLYAQLEESIIRDIARRIVKTGEMTESAKWQTTALNNLGVLNDDIIESISKYTVRSESMLKELFKRASVTATEADNKIYKQAGLKPIPINMSEVALQILQAGYEKTNGNIKNLTNTTAVTSQTTFINACTLAEMQIESGAFSYTTAIQNAIKVVADKGITVLYPSGYEDKLDVAVRRNVMTGIGQTTGQICLNNANELGWDLMEISAHCGARPSHASWQGQIVSLSGKKGYLSLSDIGYGTGDGFKGWNCRHDWYPYFEGSTRIYSKKDIEELNAKNIEFPDGSMHTYYEAEQYQRKCERAIRKTKRTLSACDEAMKNTTDKELKQNMNIEFENNSVKLKGQEEKLKFFCSKTGMILDNSRTQSLDFGKSTSQKAIGSANRYYNNWSKEHNVNNIKTLAEYYNVKYNDVERYKLLQTYVKSIDKGMLSPLAGFDLYEEYYNKIENELVGLTTSNGIKIKSQSKHFLERVFGTKDDPTHNDNSRNGVKFSDIKETLLKGIPRETHGGNSVQFKTEKCIVTVNPLNGNLIQVNPRR